MDEKILKLANSIEGGEWFSDDMDLLKFANALIDLKHEELVRIIAENYQVMAVLANDCGQFGSEHVMKALDNAAEMRIVHDDVLPFPSSLRSPVAWWNEVKDTVSTDPIHRHNIECVPLYARKV